MKIIPKPFSLLLVTSLQIPEEKNNVCNINCVGMSAAREQQHNLHSRKIFQDHYNSLDEFLNNS